jgi:hypothetical protein
MRPVRIITAFVFAAAVAVTGCTAHSTTAHPAAAPTPVSSAPPPPTTVPPDRPIADPPRDVPAPPRMTTPALAAQHLLRAWQAHDRAAALQGASRPAVDAVFARSPGSLRNPALSGCSNRAGGYDCAYSAGLTWLRFRVEGGASAGYRVQRAMFADRISDPATAAWGLYRAWAAGDYWTALAWGRPEAVRALFAAPRGRYAFRGCELAPRGSGVISFICRWAATRRGISIYVAGGASAGYGIAKVETASLPAPVPLADGRYDSYIRTVDADRHQLVVDLVQVFEGKAAVDAAIADGTPRERTQYLSVWVRNHNPRLRTLPLARDLRLDLRGGDCEAPRSQQLAKLAADARLMSGSTHTYYFTLTVTGGAVRQIQEFLAINAC